MSSRIPTHYETLGISPAAKHTDVGLAYRRKLSALRREDAPPDLKGETKLREAFEVLSDLDRRAAYDEQLRKARMKPAFGKNHAAIAALFVVAIGAGLFWHLRPYLMPETVDVPQGPGKSYQEIVNAAIPAVGRLRTVDMSGQAHAAGIAFAVEEGVLVTSCEGLSPTAQLNVDLQPRIIPARVTLSDEDLGLCKLEVLGAGSWPLSVSAVPAKAGDRVFATVVGPKGEVSLRAGQVRSIKAEGKAAVLEVSVPLLPQHGGAPLLDIYGRVVAVANMPPESKGRYVAIPVAWGETVKPPPSEPKVEEVQAEAENKTDGIDDFGRSPETRRRQEELARKIDPERRKRIEKAYRPPLPDDL
jgi:hypothetical protein